MTDYPSHLSQEHIVPHVVPISRDTTTGVAQKAQGAHEHLSTGGNKVQKDLLSVLLRAFLNTTVSTFHGLWGRCAARDADQVPQNGTFARVLRHYPYTR